MSICELRFTASGDVIEKILRHCGLRHTSSPRAPPGEDRPVHDPDSDSHRQQAPDERRELIFVDEDTFWAEFY